jgi:hypothetical protein
MRSLFVLLCLVALGWGAAIALAESQGGLVGMIESPADGLCRGLASLWPAAGEDAPDPRLSNTVPPWVAELNSDCSFSLQADPGSYYLQVILRQSPGPALGPTRKGDLIFLSPDAQGESFPVEIRSGQPIDVGSHGGGWQFPGYSEQIQTGITGQVTDEKGRPLSGFFIHAFADRSLETPPLAVSAKSDSKGRFQFRIEQGGKFYLQARKEIGLGSIAVGSLVGIYGDDKPKAVKLKKGGLVADINIKVAPQPSEKSK